jgi:hypothetical protein
MFRYCTKLGAKWANLLQLMQKFVPQSLVRISRNLFSGPHNWTLSSYFHAFLFVWVHLGPFRYYTKLETKQVTLLQLMQKFVPRCLVTISCNERSRSAPLDPKLMFWCVYFRLGAYETFLLLHETRYEMV